tara:strand:- start:314 stop:502 length:189 start_codon:yes stop_codon:yes gene_type:complete
MGWQGGSENERGTDSGEFFGTGQTSDRQSPTLLIIGFYVGVAISYGIDVIWFFGKGHAILHG